MDPARVLKISNTPMVPDNNVSNAARTLHLRADSKSSNNPSYQLRSYIDKIKQKEKDILDQRQKTMSLISWT